MSRIDKLIAKSCPGGVIYRALGDSEVSRQVIAGATPKSGVPEYWENGTIPWMSSGEVNKGTVYQTDKLITEAGYSSWSTKMVPAGAVVIALAGQGKTRGTVARTRIELCTNQSLASILVADSMNSDFLFHFLRTQYRQLREVSSGDGTRGGLNLQMIRAYKVPVPPLEVQREIVRILDQFTELEARRNQYGYYRDSLLGSSLAGDVPWRPIGDVGELIRGRRFTKADYVDNGGIPAIHYGEIYTHFGVKARSVHSHVKPEMADSLRFARPGDVILTDVGETVDDVGKAVAWLGSSDVAIHDHCYAFRHSMNPAFVSYYMQTNRFRLEKAKYVARTKVKTLLMNGLARVLIPCPPLPEQERIVKILDEFDALLNDLSVGLPAELRARRMQYEHYRDRLLTFEEASA